MSLTEAEVSLCNQALDRIGSKNFTYAVQTGVEGVKCNLIYEQTRDTLLRSYEWPFASDRLALVSVWLTGVSYITDQYIWENNLLYKCAVAHTSSTFATDLAAEKWTLYSTRPSFEYDYQYELPADFLRLKGGEGMDYYAANYDVDGTLFLTNNEVVNIRYIKKETDTTLFDTLFIEVLIVTLAKRLLYSLAGTNVPELKKELEEELAVLQQQILSIDLREVNDLRGSPRNISRGQIGPIPIGQPESSVDRKG